MFISLNQIHVLLMNTGGSLVTQTHPDLQRAAQLWILESSVPGTVNKNWPIVCVCICRVCLSCVGQPSSAGPGVALCVCLQVTALPTGSSWLRCFEERQLNRERNRCWMWLTHPFSRRSLHLILYSNHKEAHHGQ